MTLLLISLHGLMALVIVGRDLAVYLRNREGK